MTATSQGARGTAGAVRTTPPDADTQPGEPDNISGGDADAGIVLTVGETVELAGVTAVGAVATWSLALAQLGRHDGCVGFLARPDGFLYVLLAVAGAPPPARPVASTGGAGRCSEARPPRCRTRSGTPTSPDAATPTRTACPAPRRWRRVSCSPSRAVSSLGTRPGRSPAGGRASTWLDPRPAPPMAHRHRAEREPDRRHRPGRAVVRRDEHEVAVLIRHGARARRDGCRRLRADAQPLAGGGVRARPARRAAPAALPLRRPGVDAVDVVGAAVHPRGRACDHDPDRTGALLALTRRQVVV